MQQIMEIIPKELAAGISGRYIHGAGQTFGYVHIDEGAVLPEHHHIHEQITFIVEGELEMQIDGKPYLLTKGCVHVIPSNAPHSAIARKHCIVIDVFNPVRNDYR